MMPPVHTGRFNFHSRAGSAPEFFFIIFYGGGGEGTLLVLALLMIEPLRIKMPTFGFCQKIYTLELNEVVFGFLLRPACVVFPILHTG